jgi:hypothetical protein
MGSHRIEHLGRGDDGFAVLAAEADDLALNKRNLLRRDLIAQIAAGDHDAIGGLDDLFDLFDAFRVLDLGENRISGLPYLARTSLMPEYLRAGGRRRRKSHPCRARQPNLRSLSSCSEI